MSLETGKVETDVLFNRLSYKQVRHIVLLEAIVELAKFSVERWKKHDSDGACGIDDAIDVVVKDMMGIDDRAWTITCYNPKKTSLNQLLFKRSMFPRIKTRCSFTSLLSQHQNIDSKNSFVDVGKMRHKDPSSSK